MSENIIIYAGSNKAGKLRKEALKREAKRAGEGSSVAKVIWTALKTMGSAQLRADLLAADKLDQ